MTKAMFLNDRYYHCYADDSQLYLSFQTDDPMVASRMSACLTNICDWMKDHHLQLILEKTELLLISANPTLSHNFSMQLGSSYIIHFRTARNLTVVIDNQLHFTDSIGRMALTCRFAFENIWMIRPFLLERATQLFVQAFSFLESLAFCK